MRHFSFLKNFPQLHQVLLEVRTQVLLYYLGLMAVLMGISIPVIYQVVFRQIDQRLEKEVVSEIEELEDELAIKNPQNLLQLQELMVAYLEGELVEHEQFLLVLLNKEVFRSSPPIEKLPESLQPNSALIARLTSIEQPDSEEFIVNDPKMGKIIGAILPLQLENQHQGFFLVAHATLAEHQHTASAMKSVLAITGILFLLTSAGAWVLSGFALEPLRIMTATARKISAKNLSQRLPVGGKGEMAEVASTFNEMMDRLQRAFLSQRNFINDASHELRTPITIIQGHLDLIGDVGEEQQQTLTIVQEQLERMNRLVSDLLDLTKAEQPDFIQPEWMEVAVLTNQIYEKAKVLTGNNLQLEAVGKGSIYIDRQRLTQAIINLVANAVENTPPGGNIFFGSAANELDVRFWVQDTGRGIAASDRERIFNRFARAADRPRSSDGYGLGLSIVQAIVTACGGRIELESNLEQGSTFTLIFPLHPSTHPSGKKRGL